MKAVPINKLDSPKVNRTDTVIANQHQYRITQEWAERFREALAELDTEGMHPIRAKAMRDGLRSQLESFEAELAEYEKTVLSQRKSDTQS